MTRRIRKKKNTNDQVSTPCPHCGQGINVGAKKCYHCNATLTFLGKFERVSSATTIVATICTLIATVFSVYVASISSREKEEIEKIRDEIENVKSEISFSYVLGHYQKMEDSAASWRRCKALKQPDCEFLSVAFIANANNAIGAFESHKINMKGKEYQSIQQLMCVGLSITHNDGKGRGLYDSVKDHVDATSVDTINNFLKKCPKYKIEHIPVRKLQLD